MQDVADGSMKITGDGSGSAGEALPRIRLDGPLCGSSVVSDPHGELFCINADTGVISRVRWAENLNASSEKTDG